MSEHDRNQLLYDNFRQGYTGGLLQQHAFLHMSVSAGGGSGDASPLLQTTPDYGYSDLSEIAGSSNLQVEELHSGSLPDHQAPPPARGVSSSSTYHHHQGRRRYCLDPPAFPMFDPPSHPYEPPPQPPPPPPLPESTNIPSTLLHESQPWAAQMGPFNQSPAAGSSLRWLPSTNEWGAGGFHDPFTRAVPGSSVPAEGEYGADGCWVRQSAGTALGFGLRRRREVEGIRGSSNTTERLRRGKMSEMFGVLRSLIPNPRGKRDKASILTEATDYIRELLRTVGDLRGLVEAKQRRTSSTDNSRRPSGAAAASGGDAGVEGSSSRHGDPAAGGRAVQPRCSSLKRAYYKDAASVDVRVVGDDVTVKLVRRRCTPSADSCLLLVSRALHDLRLELLHLAAANVGDSLVLVVNSKIEGGSSVASGTITARTIVEALEAATALCS